MSKHLALENQLCFRIYRLNKAITKLYAPLLKDLELTYPQYLVMLVLWQQQAPISLKRLGKLLTLDSGTLSPLLKRMEKLSLLKRTRNETDERSITIELTLEGKNLKARAEQIPCQLLSLTGISGEELNQLTQSLDTLQNKLPTAT